MLWMLTKKRIQRRSHDALSCTLRQASVVRVSRLGQQWGQESMSKNLGQVDRVVVIRTESGLPSIKALDDAAMEFATWFYRLLNSGEVKPPETLGLINSDGQRLFESFIEHSGQVFQDAPASYLPRFAKIEDWPAFVVMEDSRGKKLTVRMELDCQTTF